MMKGLMCTCSAKWAEYAPLVLRVVIGIAFIMHGWQKVSGGLAGTTGFFASVGIPFAAFFAFVVTWLEFLGGIALVLGLATHWVSKLLAIDMLVAILVVHAKGGFFVPTGVELPLLLLAATISLMITGGGKYSLDAKWHTKL